MGSDMITEKDERFASMIAGFFHDMLRAAGISMTTPQKFHERTREIGRKFAYAIEYRAEKKSVEVARVLQTAVVKAFDGVENEQKTLRDTVTALEALVMALTLRTSALEAQLDEITTSGSGGGKDSRVLPAGEPI